MFKIKFASGSKSIIIIINNYVYKISINIFSYNNYVSYEYKKISIAKRNNFWKKYMPKYILNNYFIIQTQYYKENLEDNKYIFNIIKDNIQKSKNIVKFQTIFTSEKFLNYENFSEYIKHHNINLYKELFYKDIITSSVHGDFHEKNILYGKNTFKIIDWINYQENFWNKYDYYHFHIVKYSSNHSYTFMNCVENINKIYIYLRNIDKIIFNEIIDLKLYIICRVYLELKLSDNIKKFRKNKIIKYNQIIKTI